MVASPKRREGQKEEWHGRHGPGGEPRGGGVEHTGRNQAKFPGPVWPTQEGFPGPVPADSDLVQRALDDPSLALAILQGVNGALRGPAGAYPPGACFSQAGLFAELSISNRESPLSGPLLKLMGILADGSPGAVPVGGVMPEPVAPGDVADALDPRGVFAYEAPTAEGWSSSTVATAEEGRTTSPMGATAEEKPAAEKGSNEAAEGSNEAPTAKEAEEAEEAEVGREKSNAAPTAEEKSSAAGDGSNEAPTEEGSKTAAESNAAAGDNAAAEEAKAAAVAKAAAEVKAAVFVLALSP